MADNKYFIPEVEDLRVGYECEINSGLLPGLSEGWNPTSLKSIGAISYYLNYGNNMIRVPHLTKEQIEAEGWKIEQEYRSGELIFMKGTKDDGYELLFGGTNSIIVITKVWSAHGDTYLRDKIFRGSCRDINDLRYVSRLLEI
jgi:hypothetical protein